MPRFLPHYRLWSGRPIAGHPGLQPNFWDVLAFPLVIGMIGLFGWVAFKMSGKMIPGASQTISLDWWHLPEYALRSMARMMLALLASVVFTLIYATLAAKSRRAGSVLIPLLDIMQSVPILSYVAFTFTALVALFPGRLIGAELAAIFAIFTSQVWNMTFSLYQSLMNVPTDLREAANVFQLSRWQKFWRLELPFAMPGLVWNAMVSMAGGWFFVTAAESITVANHSLSLPGLGSYIGTAILLQDQRAMVYAIITMFLVIIIYDQILFRPLVVWSTKFKLEDIPNETQPKSLVWDIFRRTLLFRRLEYPLEAGLRKIRQIFPHRRQQPKAQAQAQPQIAVARWRGIIAKNSRTNRLVLDLLWYGLLISLAVSLLYHSFVFARATIGLADLGHIILLGSFTALRVVAMIALILLIWVPLGVAIGLRPRLAQFVQPLAQILAAFPANLYFPWITVLIITYRLEPNIWVSFLMILGSQWYLLFNVIAGTMTFPQDLRDAAKCFKIHGLLWWRKVILPGILPYILTGVITAAGGAWNAAIIAELSGWGTDQVTAQGLGAYIATATRDGNLPAVLVGTIVMSIFVIGFNRLLWRPLYEITAKKMRLG